MPSTYTLNNGIELIGTGEQSGTWGDTTNTNLGLLDVALDGQVTVALASAGSSGSPNSLPITDGTASNGRNRMVVFSDSGDLGATAYVQLTPNDAEKIIYIRNSLSGSRSVILFQGTYNASNDYEVPAGTTAIVYFDGAGAGAVAANVFNNAYFDGLRLGSVSVTAILDEDNMASDSATALATQQSIKAYVDSQVGTVDTLAEILAIGNTTGATDIAVDSAQKVQFRDAAIYINSSVDGQLDIVADTEIQIAATTVDVNGALDVSGTALVTGVLTTTATTVSNGGGQFNGAINVGVDDTGYDVKFFGATAGAYMLWDESADDLKLVGAAGLTVAGDIDVDGTTNLDVVDIDGAVDMASTLNVTGAVTGTSVTLTTADNTTQLTLKSTDDDLNSGPELDFYRLSASPADNDYLGRVKYIGRNDNAQDVTAVDILARMVDVSDGTEDATYNIRVMKAGTIIERVTLNETETILNEAGADLDFRVESDTVTHALFVQGSDGLVGIGTSSPSSKLHVVSSSGENKIISEATAASQQASMSLIVQAATPGQTVIYMGKTGATTNGQLGYDPNTDAMTMFTNNAERMRIDSSGNVGIGTTSPEDKLSVVGTTNREYVRVESTFSSSGSEAGIRLKTAGTNGKEYLIFNANTEGSLRIYDATAASERMRIDSSGNVGIGTSSPTNGKLEVTNASSTVPTGFFRNTSGSGNSPSLTVQGGANNAAPNFSVLDYNGNTDFVVQGAGNVGIGTSSPATKLDVLGSINSGVRVSDGTATGIIYASSEATNSIVVGTTTNHPLVLYTNNAPRITIDSSGNVGIGTSSPANLLHLYKASGGNYSIIENTSGKAAFGVGSGGEVTISAESATNVIRFLNNSGATERMRIDASGNVLVGTSSQIGSEKFGILTTGTGVFAHWKSTGTSGNPQVFRISTGQLSGGIGSGRFITCDDGGSDKFFVTGAGVVNAASATITTISDQRLKENIRDLDDGLEKVLALKPRKFDWKENKGENIKNARGFIAQELELVFPDMISNWTDEPPEGEEPYKAVNANLIPTLVKAIQEQQAIITALETRLSALEG
jgi:hypothetical protein